MSRFNIPLLGSNRGERGRPVAHTHSRKFMVSLGISGLVAAGAMLYIGYNSPKSIPGRSYYKLSAQFTAADNLTPSYQIRIGGRLVGQVLNPRVEHGLGVVDLQMKPSVGPLLSDTTLKVRPRSPVGVRFVELHPGTKGTPLQDGAMIPAAQTSITVQLDEVFGTLDTRRRREAQVLLSELGKGFLSRGEDLNSALKQGPAALRDLTAVAGAVNDVPRGVQRLVAGSDGAATAADPVRQDIATGFAPEAKALRPFVDEQRALTTGLAVAPAALRSVQGDLARISPVLAQLSRAAKDGEPTLRAAVPTLDTTRKLLREAKPGLQALPRTLGLVRTAVPPTVGLLQRLHPVLPSLDSTLEASLPIFKQLAPRDCDLKRFFNNFADMLQYRSTSGNMLRLSVEASTETLLGAKTKVGGLYQSPYAAPCAPDTQKIPKAPR